jgi:hypothetical protein
MRSSSEEVHINTGSVEGELQEACEHIARALIDGVRHGFYEMTVKVETMSSKKKSITIKGGKSYRFVV